jgi:hypothetical protein
MVPNRCNLISIKIWGWLQANKQKRLLGPNYAARPTWQYASSGRGSFRTRKACPRTTVPVSHESHAISNTSLFVPLLWRHTMHCTFLSWLQLSHKSRNWHRPVSSQRSVCRQIFKQWEVICATKPLPINLLIGRELILCSTIYMRPTLFCSLLSYVKPAPFD